MLLTQSVMLFKIGKDDDSPTCAACRAVVTILMAPKYPLEQELYRGAWLSKNHARIVQVYTRHGKLLEGL